MLYDDTGLAAWSPFGGKIEMPTLQRLSDNGLRYSQWHTTALCSPTRSTFMTGRNHHQNAMACITEGSIGFPGSNAHIPPECGSMAEVLRQNGYNTYWIGKNHNVPIEEATAGSTKRHWPLLMGWDRFYGFIGGETNQGYPTLVEDNHFVDQPYQPEDGYHLSKDLADNALQMLRDSRQSAPDRPWLMWFCPGANHAPHHVAKEWADKYKGKFDDGYEAYREWVLPRMVQQGVLPEGTDLTGINPMPPGTHDPGDDMRPWAELSEDEKKLFIRMAEVYAGFSEYTDHQVGRIVEFLEQTGQLDNTLILYCADNGASGEGTPNGSVNENKFFNGWPDEMATNLAHLEDLGSPDAYNVLPLDDRRPFEILNDVRPQALPPQDTYVYYPGAAEVPETAAVNLRGRSYRILASVDITDKEAAGVIFATGARFGGHALFLKDGKVWYVYNILGVEEQKFISPEPLTPGRYVLGVEFAKEDQGEHHETIGHTKLWVNDTMVAQGPMKTQVGTFTLCGDGLCVGRDSGDPVTAEYPKPSTFRGGTIQQVEISVGDDQYIDLEREAFAALARE